MGLVGVWRRRLGISGGWKRLISHDLHLGIARNVSPDGAGRPAGRVAPLEGIEPPTQALGRPRSIR